MNRLSLVLAALCGLMALYMAIKDHEPGPAPGEFRVIMAYESSAKMTKEQLAVFDSPVVADYLDSHCVKDGQQPGWRKYDLQTDARNDAPGMYKMWEATKPKLGTLPALIVKGQVLLWPETPTAAVSTLQRYGGK